MILIAKTQEQFSPSVTNTLEIQNFTQRLKNVYCPKVEEIEENFVSITPTCKNDQDCFEQFSDPDKRCCRRKGNIKRCLTGTPFINSEKAINKIQTPSLNTNINENLTCPATANKLENFQFLSLPCSSHRDCIKYAGANKRCCKGAGIVKRCMDGIPRIIPKIPHFSLLGRRECPNFNDINYENGQEPFAILFRHPVMECKEDKECWPFRICCPEYTVNYLESGKSYCQAPVTNLNNTLIKDYLGHLLTHIQCTPPPPAYLDLFPKPCKTTFDCLPKVCCREAANQSFCRPPKKNVVGLLAALLRVMSFFFKSK